MDPGRVDCVIRYILAVARQQEWGRQELGVIHLLKYLYLIDLAHAEQGDGQTYTGIPWVFYHFGPWDALAYERIKTNLALLPVAERRIESARCEEDKVRWRLVDAEDPAKVAGDLPISLRGVVQQQVRQFGDDTAGLLHYVYATWPMRRAAPRHPLLFLRDRGGAEDPPEEPPRGIMNTPMSEKARRRRREALAGLGTNLRSRLADLRAARVQREPEEPRYDDVFADGVRWLDSLAGKAIPPGQVDVNVHPGVWSSPARSDDEVP